MVEIHAVEGDTISLLYTPTYALALVALVFISLSFLISFGLDALARWLSSIRKEHLVGVLDRIKEELMLLGFASILISVFSPELARICTTVPYYNPLLQCALTEVAASHNVSAVAEASGSHGLAPAYHAAGLAPAALGHAAPHHRRLLQAAAYARESLTNAERTSPWVAWPRAHASAVQPLVAAWERVSSMRLSVPAVRRRLSEAAVDICPGDSVQLLSQATLHEIHIWIFTIAVVNIFLAASVMLLALAKLGLWRKWEDCAQGMAQLPSCPEEICPGGVMPENPKTGFIRAWLMACCCHFGYHNKGQGKKGSVGLGEGEGEDEARGEGEGEGEEREAPDVGSRPSSAGSSSGLLMRDSLAQISASHEPSFLDPTINSSPLGPTPDPSPGGATPTSAPLGAPSMYPMERYPGSGNSRGARSGALKPTGRGSASFKRGSVSFRRTTSLAATLSAALQAVEEPQGGETFEREGGAGAGEGDRDRGLGGGMGSGMGMGLGGSARGAGLAGASGRQMSGQRGLTRQNSTALAVLGKTLSNVEREETSSDGTTPVKKHHPLLKLGLYMCCLLLQWVSPQKMDYLTLRGVFIAKHKFKPTFDFHKVLVRTLEKDFNEVAGCRWYHFAIACILLLLNVQGSNMLFWVSVVPLVMALVIGAKLEYIMVQLAFERASSAVWEPGTAKARDSLFWFRRPELLLVFLHYILFQNSYTLANVVWTAWQFGTVFPCGTEWAVIARVVVALGTQFLCGFVTLPLYALVTHMGSDTRADAILTDDTIRTLKRLARRHKAMTGARARSPRSPNPSIWKRGQADGVKDTINGTPAANGTDARVNGTSPGEGLGRRSLQDMSLPAEVGSTMVYPESIAEGVSRHSVNGTGDIAEHDGGFG